MFDIVLDDKYFSATSCASQTDASLNRFLTITRAASRCCR